MNQNSPLFSLTGKVIIVTGATGALAGSAADYLVAQGARVAYLGRTQDKLDVALDQVLKKCPQGEVMSLCADVTDRAALEVARGAVIEKWGRIDALINGAGGNQPGATITPEKSFFDLDFAAFEQVLDLNLHGTVLPTLIFGQTLLQQGHGSVLNFSSVSADRALTRVVGYGAAKAAVENFTRWLAVDLGQRTQGRIRVNAVMPGFFLGEQNRRLLTNTDGSLTPRGETIIRNTPMGRFGEANELHGALHYLLSDAAAFVTGTTLVVDGGFTAFSGV